MADEVKAVPAAAPVAAPVAPAPAAAPVAAPTAPRATVAREEKPSSRLITNPPPAVDLDAPVVDRPVDEDTLPESTRMEMDAGRKALGRHSSPRQRAEVPKA